ncbi:hypothetical protein BDV33DRAFT_65002 [Aspergillus novoparasiticus]|uniref:Uncharacterized protein n=2 Tax=Aspergillus subgen. Circumdati TaxID=2720871 RepID=A0A5N6EXY7_9EURO|nr:hypothetical protein BDV33DRAFT_65002 [Aspergillus novoparasiticus]KAE8329063.1 hypothetical protein BDV39DRAFT_55619 [Aspergillus sergii]
MCVWVCPWSAPMMCYTSVVLLVSIWLHCVSFPFLWRGFMAGPGPGARQLVLSARLDGENIWVELQEKRQGNPKLEYRLRSD